MGEVWRPVVGFWNKYEVSNLGRVRRIKNNTVNIISINNNHHGYATVHLSDKKSKRVLVHRLVAEAFIPNPEGRPQVNHKDGNKDNNRVDNLEWVTASENVKHAYNSGLKRPSGGVPPKSIVCIETGRIYPSTWAVAREFGRTSQAALYWALNNPKHRAWGLHWKYAQLDNKDAAKILQQELDKIDSSN